MQGDDAKLWCRLRFGEPSAVYRSGTKQACRLTEGWLAEHGFCPACPADRLPPLPNNTRVGEFLCADDGEAYELEAGEVEGHPPAAVLGPNVPRV